MAKYVIWKCEPKGRHFGKGLKKVAAMEKPDVSEIKQMAKNWESGEYWIQKFEEGKRGSNSYGRFRVHKKILGAKFEWIKPPAEQK